MRLGSGRMSISGFVLSFAAALLAAQPAAPVVQSFDAQLPFAPTLVEIGRQRQLVYELHLTNFSSRPIRLERLDILTADNGPLGAFENEALASLLGRIGPAPDRRGLFERLRITPSAVARRAGVYTPAQR